MFIQLDAEITEDGQLHVELPNDLPPGKVRLAIEYPSDHVEWSETELHGFLSVEPLTGAEIVAAGLVGGWNDLDIQDGGEWIREQRHKRRERRSW